MLKLQKKSVIESKGGQHFHHSHLCAVLDLLVKFFVGPGLVSTDFSPFTTAKNLPLTGLLRDCTQINLDRRSVNA
jgi:hypothetical protein